MKALVVVSLLGLALGACGAASPTATNAPRTLPSSTARATGSPVASFPIGDPTGASAALPPDGVYRLELVEQVLRDHGASPRFAELNAGTWTMTFKGGTWSLSHIGANAETCSGSMTAVAGRYVRALTTVDGGCGWDYDFVWRTGGGGLTFIVVGMPLGASAQDILDERSMIDLIWKQVD
jgi:hypothetical protein